ncbi:hypothetical protein KVT40_006429 [Elsinoe batatas]|uniref:Uncharacterized protein n=1 Tax=Elsinoe batatas TaxID=2601811 RepID=A0A8K0L0L8_9PEZI|nr:hypothetical protein KVT40_006429 [Elsinoe batatas]
MSSHRRMHDGSQPIHPKDVGVEASNDFRDRAEDITSILTNFTENATKVISGNDVFGESLHAQLEALRQSGQIRSGDRVKIGLVGASEMGKSSTVNALIHSRELCKTELADMLAEYVNDFCTFHFEKEDEAERTANEHARMQNSAETLVQLITALHLQGSVAQTEEQIKQDLESHYQQKSIARYKRTLVQQSSVLVNDFHGGSGNVKKYSFPDVESTIAFTHPLGSTDEPGSTGRSMWPLVKRIRIHIKDHVLLQDIVVGDAPGISDTNVARVNNSKAFLDSCDFLLVFSCIGVRIASDQTVADVLSEYGERFKDKLVMVITKGDVSMGVAT